MAGIASRRDNATTYQNKSIYTLKQKLLHPYVKAITLVCKGRCSLM